MVQMIYHGRQPPNPPPKKKKKNKERKAKAGRRKKRIGQIELHPKPNTRKLLG